MHLLVALSSHGFGHIGQTAPVVGALRERFPGLRVTLRTAAPPSKLHERFGDGVRIVAAHTDVGMVQRDARHVDLEASASAYALFHRDWHLRIEEEARALQRLRPDAVLANVPYLALAGARRAGMPALALCSINWMDIYRHFLGARPEASMLLQHMQEAYASVSLFLQPVPSMPMPELSMRRAIGPLSQRGRDLRARLDQRLRLGDNERLVMVSMGGMDLRPSVERWPVLPGVRLLVPQAWRSIHPCTVDFERLRVPYIDAMCSCDALICKPGYASFVEAACAGVPVLYLGRPAWPETRYLVRWLERTSRCAFLPDDRWEAGAFLDLLEQLWLQPPRAPAEPTGVQEAVEAVAEVLR